MSLIVAIYTHEGIVLASDSRMTYTTTESKTDGSQVVREGTHFTDTVYKTFLSDQGVGISSCGDADINGVPISLYIEQFLREHKDAGVETIKDEIIGYFKSLSQNIATEFFVAGYLTETGGKLTQRLYRITTANEHIELVDTSKQGMIWGGQKNVMSRLLTTLYIKNDDGTYIQHFENPVLWQFFTMQDAIDYARYAIQVTIETMRFQRIVKTVGGPIDILAITPDGGKWISRKELK